MPCADDEFLALDFQRQAIAAVAHDGAGGIATFLGVSSGTVGSTLSRAHTAIRQRFETQGFTGASFEAGSPVRDGPTTPNHRPSPEPPEVLP